MNPIHLLESLGIVEHARRQLTNEEFEEAFLNALLRNHLRQNYIQGRYFVTPLLLHNGSHGFICTVNEPNHPNRTLVAKTHTNTRMVRREMMNYRYVEGLSGFARFHNAFMIPLPGNTNLTRSRFAYVIVAEYVGESLEILLKRSRIIHQRNVITLRYKLFLIIESMHAARLVHRSIQLKHVTLQRMPNDKLRMSLIGLDEALPLDPSPVDNLDVVSQDSSPFVDDGNPYKTFDDFTFGVYLILRMSGIDLLKNTGCDPRKVANQKPRFHQNPYHYLNKENAWIGVLYKEIQNQRVNGYNHNDLFRIFQLAIPNFIPIVSPDLEIEYILMGNETIFLG